MRKTALLSLLLPLIATSPPIPPTPLSAEQASRIRCVATLAIVANDQTRRAPGWEGLPDVRKSGAHFAGVTGAAIIKETGRSRDDVKAEFLRAVAAVQAQPRNADVAGQARGCIAMMTRLDPPPPPPEPIRCAAMAALAYDDPASKGANPTLARNLGNIAAILSNKAREKLRAAGKTEAEGDVAIGTAREALISELKAKRAQGEEAQLDLEPCIDLALG
jgi:hypothetical protein